MIYPFELEHGHLSLISLMTNAEIPCPLKNENLSEAINVVEMRLTLLKIQTNCSHRLLLNAIPFRFHVLFLHGKGFKNCESFLCDYFLRNRMPSLSFN